jgi:hypothetical protein
MLRKLGIVLTSVLALIVIGTGSAQAFTEFTNPNSSKSTIVSTPDGAGKAAHHVFVTPAGSITCSTLDLDGTLSVKVAAAITFEFAYTNCTFSGVATVVHSNGCAYIINAAGRVTIECPVGKEIEFEGGGCKVTVPAQGPLGGVGFVASSSAESTFSTSVKSIEGAASGCAGGNGAFKNGEYTTGNTILTGEEIPGPGMNAFSVS